jgi:transcriptional regulator with XRE-family HTH domain
MKSSNSKSRGVFGSRLKTARHTAGIPQDKLGVQIGLDEFVASARISRYESGTHEPPYEIAKKLSSELQVPVAFFYCEDDRMAEVILLSARFSDEQWDRLLAFIKSNPFA